MCVQVRDIVDMMERIAPLAFAEDWDNVGLLIGDKYKQVGSILVTLDVTGDTVKEAIARDADMIISHHPVIFKPLNSIGQRVEDRNILYPLIQNDIAVYSAHTNLDKAEGGVDHTLARVLGLKNTKILVEERKDRYFKLVVFVPKGYEKVVMDALGDSGAGWIGNYSHCTFQVGGIGTFKPLQGADPFIGKQDMIERVEEVRLETIIPEHIGHEVIAAMLDAHPYEEVAYDLYPLANAVDRVGLGRVGELEQSITVEDYARRVKEVLNATDVCIIGDREKTVDRVASCAGAGGDFVRQAVDAGADVFITGEIKYHDALLALELGMPVITPGHYETEMPAMKELINRLQKKFDALQYKIEILHSEKITRNKRSFI